MVLLRMFVISNLHPAHAHAHVHVHVKSRIEILHSRELCVDYNLLFTILPTYLNGSCFSTMVFVSSTVSRVYIRLTPETGALARFVLPSTPSKVYVMEANHEDYSKLKRNKPYVGIPFISK
jgi:hypothetical protein